jgi:SulP family sulfate permease
MPTLAALLIYAAAGSLHFGQIATIWRTGLTSKIGITTTFIATLLLPVAAAVGLGVVLSILLQLNQAALDLKVVELVPDADGQLQERPAPKRLASHTATLIDVYGSLHYAGARTLQEHLPDPSGTEGPALVLRMRGRSILGATFFTVAASYAKQLDAVNGRLYIAGLDPALMAQAQRTGTITDDGPVKLYEATPLIGESSLKAFHDAQTWITSTPHGPGA